YTYDSGGNILTMSDGTTSHTYTYGDSDWKDLLTAYDGQSITYDGAGNPTSYYNGSRWNLTWVDGRKLDRVESTDGTVISYIYDVSGSRRSKTVDGVTHSYIWESGRPLREILSGETEVYSAGDTLYFFYDQSGSPYALMYNGVTYYYILNGQGDVVRLVDSSGAASASYEYDPYGKILSATGSMAEVNPLRYRGYYYDAETGFYYVNSRYYDPGVGRFLNADGYASTGQGLVGFNMFAYCGNNPVNRVDPIGQFWKELWGTFIQTIQQARGYFAVAAGVSQVDSPVPGPADVVSGVLLLGGILVCAGLATHNTITAPSLSISIPKAEEKAKEKVAAITSEPSSTVIYRYGGTNPGNLTPSQRDVDAYPTTGKGLSFSTVPKPGAAMTTIEALNATGVVYAVHDGPGHVSVHPIGGTLEDWHKAGSSSIWTTAVKSVVIKWDGGK
ncbi:MAG: RHS repeat-associated core domain-containing protein, partial [Lachnospiraceae bacterium]|nr:RHS repeat-associated core domain-containing protein [Lachnospiraceae bacterium]